MPKVKYKDAGHREIHLNAVLSGSSATYASWAVLEAMCRRSEFNTNTVKITTAQLVKQARRCNRTIKEATRTLKREGSIVPILDMTGGRGLAVTYSLEAIGQGEENPHDRVGEAELRAMIAKIMAEEKVSYGEAKHAAEQILGEITR